MRSAIRAREPRPSWLVPASPHAQNRVWQLQITLLRVIVQPYSAVAYYKDTW